MNSIIFFKYLCHTRYFYDVCDSYLTYVKLAPRLCPTSSILVSIFCNKFAPPIQIFAKYFLRWHKQIWLGLKFESLPCNEFASNFNVIQKSCNTFFMVAEQNYVLLLSSRCTPICSINYKISNYDFATCFKMYYYLRVNFITHLYFI